MDPTTLLLATKLVKLVRQYWYLIVIIGLCGALWVMQLRLNAARSELVAVKVTMQSLEVRLAQQNAAVEALEAAAAVQADKLAMAVRHAAELKPRTTTIIKEVYSDKTSDIHRLVLNARND